MFTSRKLLTIALAFGVLSPAFAFAQIPQNISTTRTPLYSCVIDIKRGTNTCKDNVTVLEQANGRVKGSVKLCSMVERNQITQAEFAVKMGAKPTGWLFNVGDSSTNNGWAGDWGDGTPEDPWQQGQLSTGQSRDAEVHLNGNLAGTSYSWSAWGNDHTQNALDGHRRLFAEGSLGFANKTVKILARNEGVDFSIDGDPAFNRTLNSQYMYALNNQTDFQGPINCELFFGANRVIDGSYRNGSGVESVTVQLYGQAPGALSPAISFNMEDELLNLSQLRNSAVLPRSLAFVLTPETSDALSNELVSRGVDPATVNTDLVGTSPRSLQMAMETLRAQGLVTTTKPSQSSFRKALRRFQRRVKISSPALNSPETMAELFAAEKAGDIK